MYPPLESLAEVEPLKSSRNGAVDSVYVLTHINSIYIYWSDEIIVKYSTARDCSRVVRVFMTLIS